MRVDSVATGSRARGAYRASPVSFDAVSSEIEQREGWDVVLAYEDDPAAAEAKDASRLVDLSHRLRWDYQDRLIDERRPFGFAIPASPGEVSIRDGLMISRMNRTQASIWHIGPGHPPRVSGDVGITETTDSHCWLAVIGKTAPSVLEHLTSLELFPPRKPMPFLTQGPILGVPCQVVTWTPDCALIALSRGYGQTFVDAVFHSLADGNLVPGGERTFTRQVAETVPGER